MDKDHTSNVFYRDRQNFLICFSYLILSAFYVLINSKSTSPIVYARTLDSQIFQYMGFIMAKGKIPYTDFFDHKGLLLYFINMLGYKINPMWGVVSLQGLNLFAVCCVWYKTLIAIRYKFFRYAAIPISLLCLYPCYSCGNLTEEWSLLFISIPLMFYYRRLEVRGMYLTNKELFISGLCVGAICMIRINNIAPITGCMLYAAIISFKNKEWRYLRKSFVLILLGMIIPLAIGIMYMFCIGGLQGISDFIFANWTFNIEYSKDEKVTFDIERVRYLYKVILPIVLIVPFVLRKKHYVIPIIIGYIVTLLTIGKTQHYHYLMVFIPLLLASFTCIYPKKIIYGVLFVFLAFLNAKTFVNEFKKGDFFVNKHRDYQKLESLLRNIPSTGNKTIWSYNGAFLVDDYMKIDLLQTNRVFLPWQLNISDALMNSEKNKIMDIKPDYVLYPLYNQSWMNESAKYEYSDIDENYIKMNYIIKSAVELNDGIVVSLLERIK